MKRIGGKEEFKKRIEEIMLVVDEAREKIKYIQDEIIDMNEKKELLYSEAQGDKECANILIELENKLEKLYSECF